MRVNELSGSPVRCPDRESHWPMETSVAMKRIAFLFALLLAAPAFAAAQSQTAQTAQTAETAQTGANDSAAVRQRIVGPNRAANHAEKRNPEPNSSQPAGPAGKSSTPINQNSTEPKWGNTAVLTRPGPSERS
jgi:hypothetical protein